MIDPTDMYAGLPVRRNEWTCTNWQRMAEELMAFQDAVQEAHRCRRRRGRAGRASTG